MVLRFTDEPATAVYEFLQMTEEEMDEIFYTDDEIGDMRHMAFLISVGLEEEEDGLDVEPVAWNKQVDQTKIQNFESNLVRLKAKRKQQMADMEASGNLPSTNVQPIYKFLEDDDVVEPEVQPEPSQPVHMPPVREEEIMEEEPPRSEAEKEEAPTRDPNPNVKQPTNKEAPAAPEPPKDPTAKIWWMDAEKSKRERIVFPHAGEPENKAKATPDLVEEEPIVDVEPEQQPEPEPKYKRPLAGEPKEDKGCDLWFVTAPEKSLHRERIMKDQITAPCDDSIASGQEEKITLNDMMTNESSDLQTLQTDDEAQTLHTDSEADFLHTDDEADSIDDDTPIVTEELEEANDMEDTVAIRGGNQEEEPNEEEAKDPTLEIWWMNAEKSKRGKVLFPRAGKSDRRKPKERVVQEEAGEDSESEGATKAQRERNSLTVDLGAPTMSVAEFSESNAADEETTPVPAEPNATKPSGGEEVPSEQTKANINNNGSRSSIETDDPKKYGDSSRTESTASMNDSLNTHSLGPQLIKTTTPQNPALMTPTAAPMKKASHVTSDDETSPFLSSTQTMKSLDQIRNISNKAEATADKDEATVDKTKSLIYEAFVPPARGKKGLKNVNARHSHGGTSLAPDIKSTFQKAHSISDLEKLQGPESDPKQGPETDAIAPLKLMRTNSGTGYVRKKRRPRKGRKKQGDTDEPETPGRRAKRAESPKQLKKGALDAAILHITTNKQKRGRKKGTLEAASDHITTKPRRSKKGGLDSASDHYITTGRSDFGSPLEKKSPKRLSRRMKKALSSESPTPPPKKTKLRRKKRSSSVGKKPDRRKVNNFEDQEISKVDSSDSELPTDIELPLVDGANDSEWKLSNSMSHISIDLNKDDSECRSSRGSGKLYNSRELTYAANEKEDSIGGSELSIWIMSDDKPKVDTDVSKNDGKQSESGEGGRDTTGEPQQTDFDEPTKQEDGEGRRNADGQQEGKASNLESSWGDMTTDLAGLDDLPRYDDDEEPSKLEDMEPSKLGDDPSKLENSVIEIAADFSNSNSNGDLDDPTAVSSSRSKSEVAAEFSNSNSNGDLDDPTGVIISKSKSENKLSKLFWSPKSFRSPKELKKRISKSLTNVLKNGLDSSFHKKKKKEGKNVAAFPFSDLPADLKQKVAFFLPLGDVMNLSTTSKSMRSDLNFGVLSTPLTDSASQNKIYRTGLRTKCIGVVFPKPEARLHSMRFTCDVTVGPKPFGRVWIAEQDVPDNYNPKDLERLPFHVNKVVARSPSLESDIDLIDVTFSVRPGKMYQIFVRCRMEVQMDNMTLHRVGFPAEKTDFISYQFDAMLKS